MIYGTTIAPGQTTRTPVFERRADNAIFRYQELGGQGSASLTVKVFHKAKEVVTWTDAGSFSSLVKEVTGLGEEICLQFSMPDTDIALSGEAENITTNNIRVRVLPVQWYDDAIV